MIRFTTVLARYALMIVGAVAFLLSAAACGGGNASTPTSVPATSIAYTPTSAATASSAEPSPAVTLASPTASSHNTPAPHPTQPASPTPTQSPAPSAVSLMVVAKGLRFAPNSLSAPAAAKVNITLDNQDTGVPHDIVFKDSTGVEVAATEIAEGPNVLRTSFTPAAAGRYRFNCTVHITQMSGVLIVE